MHHLAAHGPDAQAQTAAAAILRYFDSAAPAHHADEEQDLFLALVDAMAGSDAVCIHHLIARLAAEHRVLEESWARLRPALIVARELAAKSPIAMRLAKESLNRIESLSLKDAYRTEQDYTHRLLAFEDSAEARRAFVEKRAPEWHWR